MTLAQKALLGAIDAAIGRCERAGWAAIEIHLSWTDYRVLLEIKGINWEPSVAFDTVGASHDDRPLTTYRGYPLILTGHQSIVYSRPAGGKIQGWAVVRN